MRNGDLSDEIAPGIGLRFEGIVKTEEGKLNRSAKAYLQSIARLDVNVYLITTGDPRRCMAFCVKWGVLGYKVINVTSTLEIPDVVREMGLLTYYDIDDNILANVRSRGQNRVEALRWETFEVL